MPLYMLTEMAHSVHGEEGTSGERDEYLKDNLEAKLLALTAQAKAFDARRRLGPQAAQVAAGPGMVKRLAGWQAGTPSRSRTSPTRTGSTPRSSATGSG